MESQVGLMSEGDRYNNDEVGTSTKAIIYLACFFHSSFLPSETQGLFTVEDSPIAPRELCFHSLNTTLLLSRIWLWWYTSSNPRLRKTWSPPPHTFYIQQPKNLHSCCARPALLLLLLLFPAAWKAEEGTTLWPKYSATTFCLQAAMLSYASLCVWVYIFALPRIA